MDENDTHEGQQTPTGVAGPGFDTSFTQQDSVYHTTQHCNSNLLLSELFGADIPLQWHHMCLCAALHSLAGPTPAAQLVFPLPWDCSTPHHLSLARLTRDS